MIHSPTLQNNLNICQ